MEENKFQDILGNILLETLSNRADELQKEGKSISDISKILNDDKYLLSLKNSLNGLLLTIFPFISHIFMKLSKMMILKRIAFFSTTIQFGGNALNLHVLCI